MTERLNSKLQEYGVRIVDSNNKFIEENQHDIENMLFHHSVTSTVLKIAIARGLKQIKIESKKDPFVNLKYEDLKFVYAFHNWFLLGDLTNNRLLLCKIE